MMASSSAAVIIQPQVNSTFRRGEDMRQQVLDELVARPGPVDADQDLARNRAGTWRIAAASTSLWSVNVFDPALPGRSSMARHSRVFAHQAPSGWKP